MTQTNIEYTLYFMTKSIKKRPLKTLTSIRLSQEGLTLAQELANKLGLTRSATIELAIRRLAEMEGLRK